MYFPKTPLQCAPVEVLRQPVSREHNNVRQDIYAFTHPTCPQTGEMQIGAAVVPYAFVTEHRYDAKVGGRNERYSLLSAHMGGQVLHDLDIKAVFKPTFGIQQAMRRRTVARDLIKAIKAV